MPVKQLSQTQLGRRIRQARVKLGLSQEDVAAPDYTAAYISHVEHGKRRPSQEALTHIASRLGMTLEQLISGRDPDEDLRLEVETQKAIADIHRGKPTEALRVLEDVRRQALKSDNQRVVETAETAIGRALYRIGRIDEAKAAFDRALQLIGEPPERRTTALAGKARCLFQSDEAREGVHLLEAHLRELQKTEEEADPGCLVEVYAALIPGYFETGMIELAIDAATQGWKLASNTPDAERRACLYVNRALLMVTQGHHREALASLALAEDLYRHLGWYAEAVKVAFARSFSLTKQGEWAEAERLIREALETPGATVTKRDRITITTRLALIRRNLGDAKGGLELATQALKLARSGFVGSAAEAEREIGLCKLALGDATAALDHWREALAKFQTVGDSEETAKTARLIGDHLAEAGDVEGAAKAYRQGLEAMEELR